MKTRSARRPWHRIWSNFIMGGLYTIKIYIPIHQLCIAHHLKSRRLLLKRCFDRAGFGVLLCQHLHPPTSPTSGRWKRCQRSLQKQETWFKRGTRAPKRRGTNTSLQNKLQLHSSLGASVFGEQSPCSPSSGRSPC